MMAKLIPTLLLLLFFQSGFAQSKELLVGEIKGSIQLLNQLVKNNDEIANLITEGVELIHEINHSNEPLCELYQKTKKFLWKAHDVVKKNKGELAKTIAKLIFGKSTKLWRIFGYMHC